MSEREYWIKVDASIQKKYLILFIKVADTIKKRI